MPVAGGLEAAGTRGQALWGLLWAPAHFPPPVTTTAHPPPPPPRRPSAHVPTPDAAHANPPGVGAFSPGYGRRHHHLRRRSGRRWRHRRVALRLRGSDRG